MIKVIKIMVISVSVYVEHVWNGKNFEQSLSQK
jgi:hypothetical protein